MRKIYFFLLALCCAMMASLPAMAQYELKDGIFYKTIDDVDLGACGHVVQYNNRYKHLSGDVAISSYVDGIGTIRVIDANAFLRMEPTVNITLPNTIQKINYNAFYEATGLQSITLNEGLTTMGSQTFYHCSNLVSVSIPTTLTGIPRTAFSGCKSLTSIVIPSATTTTIGEDAFLFCTALESVNGGSADPLPVKTIAEGAFGCCENLSIIRLSENLKSIGKEAFFRCKKLESIELPASLNTIGERAFAFSGIKQITTRRTTPQNITKDVFSGVKLYQCVLYVPAGCRAAYQNANGWKDFGQILEPGELPEPVDDAPYSGLHFELHEDFTAKVIEHDDNQTISGDLTIPATITNGGYTYTVNEIEERAFRDCINITSVTLPNTITIIPDKAFSDCGALQTVTLPSSLTKMGAWAFSDCRNLQSVHLPATLKEIGSHAFHACESLKSITIPAGVKVIPEQCFSTSGLTSIRLQEGLTEIQQCAFAYYLPLETITFPKSLTSLGAGIFDFSLKLTSIRCLSETPPEASQAFAALNIYSEEGCILYVPAGSKAAYAAAPGWSRFYRIEEKGVNEKVKYGDLYYQLNEDCTAYVTYEKNDNTNYSDLVGEVTVADKVVYNGFEYKVTAVGPNAFMYSKNITKVNLPKMIDKIYGYAFANSNVNEINLPATLTYLSYLAFNESALYYSYKDALGALYYDGCLLYCPVEDMIGSYTVKEGTRLIASNVFSGASHISELYIPEGVECICENAIDYMYSLQTLSLPSTLYKLGQGFCSNYCPNLNKIYNYSKMPLELPESGYFTGWKAGDLINIKLYVPYGTSTAYYAANKWKQLNIEEMGPIYTVTFVDYDGRELKTEQVSKYYAATAPEDPVRDGYEFEGWDTQFAEVESDLTVTAQYIEVQEPEVKTLTGRFSVGDGKQIIFASGNLRYNAGKDVWALSNNQYDTRDRLNLKASSSYDGWIDLFGYATSGGTGTNPAAPSPWETSKASADYRISSDITTTIAGTGYDWLTENQPVNGNGASWRLISKDEWTYLLNNRTDANLLQGQAVVNDVKGYILLPDDWTCPAEVSFTPLAKNYTTNVFSLYEWELMEDAGAVFLPAAGYRYNTSIMASHSGYYWTGDLYGTDQGVATSVYFTQYTKMTDLMTMRCNACAIRPVRDANTSIDLILVDNSYNKPIINAHHNLNANVTISGRTLYRDGDWNTLCLPFSLETFEDTPLEGATVMSLGNSGACNTGFDAETGVLSLDFVEANEIEAGVPYIVKWTTTGSNIVNPVFRNVTVSHESPNYHEVISKDKKVGFVGTYAPVKITVNDKSSLFLGAENKLYYPNDANDVDGTYHVNAFRAYLHIDPSAEVKEFRLRFGEDDEDGIVNANLNVNRNDGAIYNLSGQRLNKMQKGVNIVNGKKVIY